MCLMPSWPNLGSPYGYLGMVHGTRNLSTAISTKVAVSEDGVASHVLLEPAGCRTKHLDSTIMSSDIISMSLLYLRSRTFEIRPLLQRYTCPIYSLWTLQ